MQGIVTKRPAQNIGMKNSGYSRILKKARGIQAAKLLDLAKNEMVIKKVILLRLESLILGLIFIK